MSANGSVGSPVDSAGSHRGDATPRDPAAIEADIARQREELARTVDALSAKLDVKARAGHKVADLKNSATTESGRPRPLLLATSGALLGSVVLLVWWRRKH